MNIVRQSSSTPTESSITRREWDPFRMMRDLFRWDPYRELSRWEPFREAPPYAADFIPSMDVRETPKEVIFKVEVPGMKEQDIEVSVAGNRLTISGKREEEKKSESETYVTMERSYGSFCRSFTLPEAGNADAVKADLSEGVLTVVVPKKNEAQPRRVNVQSSTARPRAEEAAPRAKA